MRLLCLLFAGMLVCWPGLSQDKHRYDLDFPEKTAKSSGVLQSHIPTAPALAHAELENDVTAMTLLSDGYFTLGTTGGTEAQPLDDHCQISFGHPYALTSYVFFNLDGVEQHPETYFYGTSPAFIVQGDSLLGLRLTDGDRIELSLDLIARNGGEGIRLALRIKNLDGVSHLLAPGVLFDPALGRWGDGYLTLNGQPVMQDTILTAVPTAGMEIRERAESPKGMGVAMDFLQDTPQQVWIGNWFDLHFGRDPLLPALYDLALRMEWPETVLAPGAHYEIRFDLRLLLPEFPQGIFMRADLPYFLSVENNLLFPRQLKSLVKIFNNGSSAVVAADLSLDGAGYVENWSSPDTIDVPAAGAVYHQARLDIPENYEDRMVTLTLDFLESGVVLDRMTRDLFVPAAPFSDSGLVVQIDTVISAGFPQVDLIFRAWTESSGLPLLDLRNENVFFYEDQAVVPQYTLEKDTSGGVNQADIIFVLDVTGSMSDEIDGVKNNIVEFTDSLSLRGIDFRLGMVTFLDIIENVYEFTSDVQQFQQYVNQQYAHGGGDTPENSLEALYTASQFQFRPAASRIIIWITDANYHINNQYTSLTVPEVVDALLAQGIVAHGIGKTQYQLEYFDPILLPTGGDFFDIYGNFRDILLEISRLPGNTRYRLSYTSGAPGGMPHQTTVEVHYAGLGGNASAVYTPPVPESGRPAARAAVRSFPNPFNPVTHIRIHNPRRYRGKAAIYNLLGQRVKQFVFASGKETVELAWDATDETSLPVSAGLYFLQVRLFDAKGESELLPVQKMIHTK